LGAKPEKAFRIHAVRNLIIAFPMNREPEPNYPLYYVEMLQFLKPVDGSRLTVDGKKGVYNTPPRSYIGCGERLS
jgi:hypothetical protein